MCIRDRGAAAQAPAAQSLFLDTGLWLGLTVLTGAGLPLLVLAVKRFKAKRRRRP